MYEGGQKGRAWDEADPYAFLGRRPGMAVSYCAVSLLHFLPFVAFSFLYILVIPLAGFGSMQVSKPASEQNSIPYLSTCTFSSLLFSSLLLKLFICCIHTFTTTPFVFSVSYFVSNRPEGPFLIRFTWILYILLYLCLGGDGIEMPLSCNVGLLRE